MGLPAHIADITNFWRSRSPTLRQRVSIRATPLHLKLKTFCNALLQRFWVWHKAFAAGAEAPCTCAGKKPARWAQTRLSAPAYLRLLALPGRANRLARTRWQ